MVDRHRGHKIVLIAPDTWAYADTGKLVKDDPNRPCGHCGMADTPEGHDGCLGTVPGAINACCGHGNTEAAYVQLEGGKVVSGASATELLRT